MEQLLEDLPKLSQPQELYRSFIYQPERVSLNSRQTLSITPQSDDDFDSDIYSQFRCDLKSPLLRVKSLELLRASLPNAVASFPNDELFFFYYRVPQGALGQPDWASFTSGNIYCIQLLPTDFYLPPSSVLNPNSLGWNTTFEDYQALVDMLNNACANNSLRLGARFIANDISFRYNPTLNKIEMIGNNMFDGGGTFQYFYSPVGYNDPNLPAVIAEIKANYAGAPFAIPRQINTDGYTLNRRLGFTFNGIFGSPPTSPQQENIIWKRTIPYPDFPIPYAPATTNNAYTAESYCDLVNTANIYLYTDIVGGSTQDTNSEDRLLAVIPGNASSLGVVFGESKIPCELTKTSENIYSIVFSMRDDKGAPFYLPTNAYINLELKVSYR